VLEEFGASRWSRDELFASTYDITYSAALTGGAAGGDMFWLLAGSPSVPDYDTYTVYPDRDASTLALVAKQVARMRLLDAPPPASPPPPPPPPPASPAAVPPLPHVPRPPFPCVPPLPAGPSTDAEERLAMFGAIPYMEQ
jgi:hypothetical protein